MLSSTTFNKYQGNTGLNSKKQFLKDWFGGEKSGSKKVSSAIRIFDSNKDITFPEYLTKALQFDT